ncbi:DciA family protein [Streptomyces sp. NBC_00878]|uniref:DciA family protein n=1 Tax=Streptomyces sp. NBC_00878 TaxID=2975854 RepID=UPI002254AFF6|nr:DciA family protein [Streptomyces sp. NBC_00878]MCX4911898.1 DciA family protein [Streptomyces sp. NBC_00878]
MSQQPSGIDLARAALASARAAAKTRPAQPQRKKTRSTQAGNRRAGDPMGLGSAITRMMTDRGWQPPEVGGSILDQWPTIAPELADKVAAVRFEHDTGTLHLRPATHTYATQLRLYQAHILTKVQQSPSGGTVRSLRILPAGTSPHSATTDPEDASAAPVEAPVRTRQTASPGYRTALESVLAHRPDRAPADPYIVQAMARQEAALRANRAPEDEHRDAVWEEDRLEQEQRRRDESVRRAAIARKRKEDGGQTPARLFGVA